MDENNNIINNQNSQTAQENQTNNVLNADINNMSEKKETIGLNNQSTSNFNNPVANTVATQANNTVTSTVVNTGNNNNDFKKATSNIKQSTFEHKKSKKNKSNAGFGKTVLLPFACGILGAGIVIGTCFGVPSIRNNILGTSGIQESTSQINTQQISLLDYSNTAVGVAQKVLPSIVGISVSYTVNSPFYGAQGTAEAQGSGVIISDNGYILTNNHVVNSSTSSSFYSLGEASKITVTLYNDDTEYEAQIVGTDEQTDLAVIKIDKDGLTAAELGDSDSVQVGEFCMAIGNPLGLGITVTDGIVSAVNREVTDSDNNTYEAIQTNAAINAGNSGGALVNSQGQVIGINTLKVSGEDVEGVGFAIPINSTKDITDQLIQYNKVKRPYLGIGGIDVTEDMAKQYNLTVGVYVKQLENFCAAEKAGIKVGDVIVKADGQEIKNMNELNEIKNKKEIGDKITLTVWRDGKTQDIDVTLQEQP